MSQLFHTVSQLMHNRRKLLLALPILLGFVVISIAVIITLKQHQFGESPLNLDKQRHPISIEKIGRDARLESVVTTTDQEYLIRYFPNDQAGNWNIHDQLDAEAYPATQFPGYGCMQDGLWITEIEQ